MAVLRAFRPLRYNPTAVGDLPAVVAPPYDVISAAQRAALHARSEYNVVRLILNAAADPYAAAAERLQAWRRDGVLVRDAHPSLGYHIEDFPLRDGSRRRREGILGIVRLEPFASGRIRPHERTFARAKEDRMRLLRACRANLSPIFSLFPNQMGLFDPLRQWAQTRRPDMALSDDAGVHHRLWLVTDPASIAATTARLADETLFIADGHHRYETALTYRNERRAGAETGSGIPAPYDSVMMTFVDMDRPGLVILPTHRLVFGLAQFSAAQFQAEARKFFNVEEVDAGIDAARATAILQQAGHAGTALLAVTAERAFLMHTPKAIGSALFGTLSLRQQVLDVVQLHKCLLEGVLKISEEAIRNQDNVSYCRETADALSQVQTGKVQAAFLMNPVRMEQVRDIAFAGEVLPQKSTDFYPKLLSGLTIYALE